MNKTEHKFQIAIIDDHVGIREGYRAILGRIPYVFSVWPFSNFSDLKKCLLNEQIHLILIDIQLKNENGLDICKSIKNSHPAIKILMFSSHHNEAYIINAYQNEADGYLFKEAELSEIRKAVDTILIEEKTYFDLEGLQIIHEHHNKIRNRNKNSKTHLSAIEIKVARNICEGKKTKEIAQLLGLAPSTINSHRHRIWKKLGVHNSAELMTKMISNGLFVVDNLH